MRSFFNFVTSWCCFFISFSLSRFSWLSFLQSAAASLSITTLGARSLSLVAGICFLSSSKRFLRPMRRSLSMSLCMERRSISGDSASESVSVLERRPRRPGPRVRRREAAAMLGGGTRRLRAAGRGVMAVSTVRCMCCRSWADGTRGRVSVRTCNCVVGRGCCVPSETTSISSSATRKKYFQNTIAYSCYKNEYRSKHLLESRPH